MTTTTEPASLAERLRAAETTAAERRQRADVLQGCLNHAVSVGEYDEAARLQADLRSANEAMVLADAEVAALRSGHAAVEEQHAAATREIELGRQRDQAQRDLDAARDLEQRGREQIREATESMYQAIASAQRFLRQALAGQMSVAGAQARQIQVRGRLGEWAAGEPGPTPPGCNLVDVLIQNDSLLSHLATWAR